MPNYLEYHKSLTDELHALKDRIRNLVDHWPSDGEYKEAALRTVLRRHLPTSLTIGRGFIVDAERSSTQVDVLIVDGTKPTLFHEGDLIIVTPDCVLAAIEIKTRVRNIKECAIKLAEVGSMCRNARRDCPWLGVFSFEASRLLPTPLLDAMEEAFAQTGIAINCLAYGKDWFVRFWPKDESETGDMLSAASDARWRAYRLQHLASAYFIGNVVDAVSKLDRPTNAFAWYPLSDGKLVHRAEERILRADMFSEEENK